MDECIASPKLESTSLPLAQINLEKMFTYMQIQKSSSNLIAIIFGAGFARIKPIRNSCGSGWSK